MLTKKRSRRYPAKTITDADYADDIALLANTPNQAETLRHSLERAAAGIGLHVNAHKTEFMCFNQKGDISTLDGTSLKLVDKFTYLGSSVSSTEKDIDTRLTKAWTAIDRLSIIWKSNLSDKMKHSFFQAGVVAILLYGCTTWTLTKRLEKKLDGNYTRMLRAILNKSWQQHPTKRQLYGHLPPITKTIKVRRTRHAGHCWRSKDEIVSDVLQWTPASGQSKAGRPARTYIQQLYVDTVYNPEDLPEAMNDRETWKERVRDIRASHSTWWWWWLKNYYRFLSTESDVSICLVLFIVRTLRFQRFNYLRFFRGLLIVLSSSKIVKLNLKHGASIIMRLWVWYSQIILPMKMVVNGSNPYERGTQITDLSVMIGRCFFDNRYDRFCHHPAIVGCRYFRNKKSTIHLRDEQLKKKKKKKKQSEINIRTTHLRRNECLESSS